MNDPADENQREHRLKMIRQALKTQAPLMYEDLESSGRLQLFVEGHDEEMIASYTLAKEKAWEDTVKTFLTFADSEYDETSSPM